MRLAALTSRAFTSAALDYFKEVKKEDRRFRTIVNNIGTYCDQTVEKEALDFLVRPLSLCMLLAQL